MLPWQAFAATAIITYAIATILQRKILGKTPHNPISFAILFQFFVTVCIGIFALVEGIVIPTNIVSLIPLLAVVCTAWALFNVCVFRALAVIGASEFTVLFMSRSIWIVLLSLVFLQEVLSIGQVMGIALILLSAGIILFKKTAFQWSKGTFYALSAAVLFGIGFVGDYFLLQSFPVVTTYNVLNFFFPGVIMALIYPGAVREIGKLWNVRLILPLIATAIIFSIMAITTLLAFKAGGNASQVGPVLQLNVVATVILGALFLGEKDNLLRKLIAAVIGIIGVFLIG
jgi:drug/metabolite transporter (DMT)-like permease